MTHVLASWPRLTAALGVAAATAFVRLHLEGALIRGASGEGMLLLTILFAAPLYLVASVGSALITIVPGLPDRLRRIAGSAVLPVCGFALGSLSTNGPADRVALGAALAVLAFLIEWPLDASTRRTRASVVTAGVLAVALLVTVPLLRLLGPSTDYRNNVGLLDRKLTRNVIVLGLDGVDWRIFNELIDKGELPNLAAIAEEGHAAPLRTLAPTSSPFIWNSIYTGYDPNVHLRRPVAFAPYGDLLVEAHLRSGLPDVPTDLMTAVGWPRVRYPFAIWDVLASAGYETAVIGSWERTPVPKGHRIFAATSHRYEERWPADRHLGVSPGRHIWIDPDLTEEVAACELPPASIPAEEWRAIVGEDVSIDELLRAPYEGNATPVEQRLARARAVFASDRLRMKMAEVVAARLAQPYFLFLYIRGIDVIQHCYLHLYRGDVPPEEQDRTHIIELYHRQVDAWVGEVRSWLDEDDILLVVSDHGVNFTEHQDHPYKTGFHDYAPDGIFLANVRRPTTAPRGAHVYDVTPTILSLLDLPVLASMEGRVVPAVAPRTISVTDWRTLTPAVYQRGDPDNSDPELIELLKSLGYL